MATIDDLIVEVAGKLEDPTYVRYTEPDHVRNANRAIESVCRAKPNAYTVRDKIKLVSGTMQSLPARRHLLIRPLRNMGGGNSPGTMIRMSTFEDMDDSLPDWHSTNNSTEVLNVVYDKEHPLEFGVYPPANTKYIEVVNAAIPDDVGQNDDFPLPLIYRLPVVYWMCAYALEQNRADANFSRAKEYIGLALSALGIQTSTEQ